MHQAEAEEQARRKPMTANCTREEAHSVAERRALAAETRMLAALTEAIRGVTVLMQQTAENFTVLSARQRDELFGRVALLKASMNVANRTWDKHRRGFEERVYRLEHPWRTRWKAFTEAVADSMWREKDETDEPKAKVSS